MIKIIFNEFNFIILDIIIGCIMAFLGILTLGKARKISFLFFILTALCLYLSMVFRVLDKLNIFTLNDLLFFDVPVFSYLIHIVPSLFFSTAFIFILIEKK